MGGGRFELGKKRWKIKGFESDLSLYSLKIPIYSPSISHPIPSKKFPISSSSPHLNHHQFHPFHHPNPPIQYSTSPCFYLCSLRKDTIKYYIQTKSTLLFLLLNIVKIIYFWFITYLKWTHPESELILNLLQNFLIIWERKAA